MLGVTWYKRASAHCILWILHLLSLIVILSLSKIKILTKKMLTDLLVCCFMLFGRMEAIKYSLCRLLFSNDIFNHLDYVLLGPFNAILYSLT